MSSEIQLNTHNNHGDHLTFILRRQSYRWVPELRMSWGYLPPGPMLETGDAVGIFCHRVVLSVQLRGGTGNGEGELSPWRSP